jgi:hypothetical protein
MSPRFALHEQDLWKRAVPARGSLSDFGMLPGYERGWIHISQAKLFGHDPDSMVKKVSDRPWNAFELRETQRTGREFCLARDGVIIGDSPRLGKTGLGLATHSLEDGPLWIIAPLMTLPVWQRWVKISYDVDLNVVSQTGVLSPVNFLNYENVNKYKELLGTQPAALMIVDEAHRLANDKTSISAKAVRFLSRFARRRILLSGTPIRGRLFTLWPLLAVANPGAWGSPHEFGVRYCAGEVDGPGWKYHGLSNVDELRTRLEHVLLRRTRSEVSVQRHLHNVSVDLSKWPTLRARREGILDMAKYRLELGLAKLEQSKEFLRGLVPQNPIVWVWHKDVGTIVRNTIKGHFIHGGMPLKKRYETIARWNGEGGPLIATIPSAQEGIDLSAHESPVVFLELDYVPASIGQAEMRPYGQGKVVQAHYIVDPPMDAVVAKHVTAKVSAEEAVLGQSILPEQLFETDRKIEVVEDLSSWLSNAWDQDLTI